MGQGTEPLARTDDAGHISLSAITTTIEPAIATRPCRCISSASSAVPVPVHQECEIPPPMGRQNAGDAAAGGPCDDGGLASKHSGVGLPRLRPPWRAQQCRPGRAGAGFGPAQCPFDNHKGTLPRQLLGAALGAAPHVV
jgi:hypothetical protein